MGHGEQRTGCNVLLHSADRSGGSESTHDRNLIPRFLLRCEELVTVPIFLALGTPLPLPKT